MPMINQQNREHKAIIPMKPIICFEHTDMQQAAHAMKGKMTVMARPVLLTAPLLPDSVS